ncbi:MAG TPA: response regulator [candidate division WOR-3 bacterium]|uniref:Response regulator n=1 Tax=candidate division WOR-3 bacterium TaxID=2052148 RepID=A0A7V0T6U7_UNCW3|nr:response regulator [candidate division WOR-3 bacterium]
MNERETSGVLGQPGPLVLVVDDEEDIRFVIKARLEAAGFRVVTAATGLEGLTQARRLRPGLVLLDLMLPGIDGFSVCAMLKRDRQFSKMPVIILSARSQDKDFETGISLGADAYLTKPFSGPELIGKVRELLSAREDGRPEDSLENEREASGVLGQKVPAADTPRARS